MITLFFVLIGNANLFLTIILQTLQLLFLVIPTFINIKEHRNKYIGIVITMIIGSLILNVLNVVKSNEFSTQFWSYSESVKKLEDDTSEISIKTEAIYENQLINIHQMNGLNETLENFIDGTRIKGGYFNHKDVIAETSYYDLDEKMTIVNELMEKKDYSEVIKECKSSDILVTSPIMNLDLNLKAAVASYEIGKLHQSKFLLEANIESLSQRNLTKAVRQQWDKLYLANAYPLAVVNHSLQNYSESNFVIEKLLMEESINLEDAKRCHLILLHAKNSLLLGDISSFSQYVTKSLEYDLDEHKLNSFESTIGVLRFEMHVLKDLLNESFDEEFLINAFSDDYYFATADPEIFNLILVTSYFADINLLEKQSQLFPTRLSNYNIVGEQMDTILTTLHIRECIDPDAKYIDNNGDKFDYSINNEFGFYYIQFETPQKDNPTKVSWESIFDDHIDRSYVVEEIARAIYCIENPSEGNIKAAGHSIEFARRISTNEGIYNQMLLLLEEMVQDFNTGLEMSLRIMKFKGEYQLFKTPLHPVLGRYLMSSEQ